jgi:hypothetical protein
MAPSPVNGLVFLGKSTGNPWVFTTIKLFGVSGENFPIMQFYETILFIHTGYNNPMNGEKNVLTMVQLPSFDTSQSYIIIGFKIKC